MKRQSLQSEVRKTRARLVAAQQRGNRRGIIKCLVELRKHSNRAYDEAKRGGFHSKAGDMLRELADKTEYQLTVRDPWQPRQS